MKKPGAAARDPLEFDLGGDEDQAPVSDDVTAFDPFGAESGTPVAAPARSQGGPLRLDFSEVLRDDDLRGAQHAGAGSLDTSQFTTREQQEALARAKRISTEQPAILELEEERKGAVRVVAENRMPYLWFALALLAVAALVVGGLVLLHEKRQARTDAELQRLIEDAEQSRQDSAVAR